jgi:hypothetical protein
MLRRIQVVAVLLALAGCGGGRQALPVGFVNQTRHSDAELWAIWKAAQRSIARQVDLNPLQRSLDPNAGPILRPGDPRALSVEPHHIRVAAEPDVSAAALYAATGVTRGDPTGLISCPRPCNVRYAAAYSWYTRTVTKYAASWEFEGNNFPVILQYEFENHILYALGYDMRWR